MNNVLVFGYYWRTFIISESLTPSRIAISNLMKKWFNSSNQITLEHVIHKKHVVNREKFMFV